MLDMDWGEFVGDRAEGISTTSAVWPDGRPQPA